ncbi:MAG: hypothetical protein ING19_17205 [Azospirillum sp.]|nr:hypothetical protein [Azospirillum sp.]
MSFFIWFSAFDNRFIGADRKMPSCGNEAEKYIRRMTQTLPNAPALFECQTLSGDGKFVLARVASRLFMLTHVGMSGSRSIVLEGDKAAVFAQAIRCYAEFADRPGKRGTDFDFSFSGRDFRVSLRYDNVCDPYDQGGIFEYRDGKRTFDVSLSASALLDLADAFALRQPTPQSMPDIPKGDGESQANEQGPTASAGFRP